MAKQILKKNIAGFIDHRGIFRPIRSGNDKQGNFLPGYDPQLAGDNDNEFQRWDRAEKNEQKAEKIYEKRQLEAALDDALGDERKVSLSQYVRRSGGLYADPKDYEFGELEQFTFKQSGVRGIAHPKGKHSLDSMRESADEAGYSTKDGMPLSTVNDFTDALAADLKGRKIYPFGTLGAYKHNPSDPEKFQKFFEGNLKIGFRLQPTVKISKQFLPNLKKAAAKGLVTWEESDGVIYAHRLKQNMAAKKTNTKTKKRTTAKRPKKNTGIETAATIAVGLSAGLNVIDRLTKNPKKQKPIILIKLSNITKDYRQPEKRRLKRRFNRYSTGSKKVN